VENPREREQVIQGPALQDREHKLEATQGLGPLAKEVGQEPDPSPQVQTLEKNRILVLVVVIQGWDRLAQGKDLKAIQGRGPTDREM
jgi:hypothetical protein